MMPVPGWPIIAAGLERIGAPAELMTWSRSTFATVVPSCASADVTSSADKSHDAPFATIS